MTKVVVIGLDGAGYHLLGDWIRSNDLPTLSTIQSEGRYHALQSCLPPVTSPAWRCYSTGVNPGKLGVFWWERFNRADRSITVPDSQSYQARDVWSYLGDDGLTSAIVNMPTTQPPEALNGWMISGGGLSIDDTYPPELIAELEEAVGYMSGIDRPIAKLKDDPEMVDEITALIDSRFDAAMYLLDEYDPDFLHVSLFVTNAIQHYIWGGERIKGIWKHVDDRIGDLIDEDRNLVIMSDHGSQRIETVFNINSWLEREGYLTSTRSASDQLFELGIDKESMRNLADRMGLTSVARSVIPRSFVSGLPESTGGVGGSAKTSKIDWDETTVFASGQGPIYILDDDREAIREELIDELRSVRDPAGRPIARDVLRAEEAYSGPYVEDGPDLVIDQADGVHIPDVIGDGRVFVDPGTWKWESENHRDGVFMAHGPDVANGGELEAKPRIYDLVPTILHWYDVPVPTDLDGEVLTEVFKAGSDPARRSVVRSNRSIHDEPAQVNPRPDDEMIDHLRDLGYFSN